MTYLAEVLPDWHLDAACRGMDPRVFFPVRGESSRKAKQTCGSCPVQVECLEWALTNLSAFEDQVGIWGGLSARQRKPLRRERRAA